MIGYLDPRRLEVLSSTVQILYHVLPLTWGHTDRSAMQQNHTLSYLAENFEAGIYRIFTYGRFAISPLTTIRAI